MPGMRTSQNDENLTDANWELNRKCLRAAMQLLRGMCAGCMAKIYIVCKALQQKNIITTTPARRGLVMMMMMMMMLMMMMMMMMRV